MTTTKEIKREKVVPIRAPAAARQASERKWGVETIAAGFCILPSLLLQAQRRLGLSPTQLAFVVQLADFWWDNDRNPWPKKGTLAERLGLSEKQVQRIARQLEQRGYLERIVRKTPRGQTSNGYDLSGLVKRLGELAPEFAAAAAAKRKVERRGGLKAAG